MIMNHIDMNGAIVPESRGQQRFVDWGSAVSRSNKLTYSRVTGEYLKKEHCGIISKINGIRTSK